MKTIEFLFFKIFPFHLFDGLFKKFQKQFIFFSGLHVTLAIHQVDIRNDFFVRFDNICIIPTLKVYLRSYSQFQGSTDKNLEPVRSSGLMVRGSLVLGELTLRKSSYQIEGYPVVGPRIPSYQLVELYFSKNFVAYSIIGSI